MVASTSVATRGTVHLLNPASDAQGRVTLGENGVSAILLDSSDLTALDSQREAVRNIVREKKAGEALELWARDLRARAYVEIREEPQL